MSDNVTSYTPEEWAAKEAADPHVKLLATVAPHAECQLWDRGQVLGLMQMAADRAGERVAKLETLLREMRAEKDAMGHVDYVARIDAVLTRDS